MGRPVLVVLRSVSVCPIDYLCQECGASFEVGAGSLLTDDFEPGCPVCESDRVETDWDAVVRRFGDPADVLVESPTLLTAPKD